MNLEEMRQLPEQLPMLRETGFFVGGFGGVIDLFVMPVCLAALYLFPRWKAQIGRFLLYALKHWTPDGQWAILNLMATGKRNGMPIQIMMRVSHDDAYELTALATTAAIMQYASQPKKVGLFTQAEFLCPQSCFDFLVARGVKVSIMENQCAVVA